MTAYVQARKQALKAGTWHPTPPSPVKPADLPHLVAILLEDEVREAYLRYVAKGAPLNMLCHVLRFGVEVVKARGYVR